MDNAVEFLEESFCPELKDWQTRGPPHLQFDGFLPVLPGGCGIERQVFSNQFSHPPSIFLLNLKQKLQI